ncbi:MAG: hypothetical protein ACF8R7_16865 [Phycisphaerales bacterium JB039]
MLPRLLIAACAIAASSGAAHAQVKKVAFVVNEDYPVGFPIDSRPVDAGLAASTARVVTTSNQYVTLYTRAGSLIEEWHASESGFPFKRVDTEEGILFDPRVEYDPINGRLWMICSEQKDDNLISVLHLAVSHDETPDSFSTNDWYIFTNAQPGATGPHFDLADESIDPDLRFITIVDLPTMAIDDQFVYIATSTKYQDSGTSSEAFIIIPLSNAGDSLLDGDRPDESTFSILYGVLHVPADTSTQHYAVQEPFDEFDNAQFFLSNVPEFGERDEIRLSVLYQDEGDWEYRLPKNASGAIADPELDEGYEFFTTSGTPVTPESGWGPAAGVSNFFSSAVLVYDPNYAPTIFAVQQIHESDGGTPPAALGQFLVQWYVIDPDLDDYQSDDWAPAVLQTGRFPESGDAYHPVIGVTPQGVAYIEYIYSDSSTWPQLRRAQLNNSYTSVADDDPVQPGPSAWYDSDHETWADFTDMQADPVGCGFWSLHVLVHDPGGETASTDERAAWLVEHDLGCNNAELTGDGVIDDKDLYLFNEYYALGSRRVDMNRDFKVDFVDYAIYTDEYAKRPK